MATQPALEAFCEEARQLGAQDAVLVSPKRVYTAAWVRWRCQYGCPGYGQCLTCPPHSPTPETTRAMLDEYRAAILLHGPGIDPLREVAKTLERKIFLAGYYKCFGFRCGPCDLCRSCVVTRPNRGKAAPTCRHPYLARPAMEAAGIDVFATARAAGLPIEVVCSRRCRQDYYALVLVE